VQEVPLQHAPTTQGDGSQTPPEVHWLVPVQFASNVTVHDPLAAQHEPVAGQPMTVSQVELLPK